MRGHGAGKTLAREHGRAQARDHRPEPADIGIVRQKLERIIETRACLQQQCEVARKRRHFRAARPAEEAKAVAGGRGLPVLDGFDRQQAQIFDAARDFARRRRRERAMHDLAVLCQGPVAKIRHVVTVRS